MPLMYVPKQPNKKNKKLYPVFVGVVLVLGSFFIKQYLNFKKNNSANNVVTKIELLKQKPKPKNPDIAISKIKNYLGTDEQNYAYYVYNLNNNQEFGVNETQIFTAASSIKVAFAAYIYNLAEKGQTNLQKKLIYTRSDYEEGTGILIAQPFGTAYSVEKYIELMITRSDNAATNVLIRNYGRANFQNYLNNLGLAEINVSQNKITPKALGTLLKMLYKDELGIDSENKEKLFQYLKNSLVAERLKAGLPQEVEIAHKIGTQVNSISDSGIVFLEGNPYVISVFCNKFPNEKVANANIAAISKIIFEFYKED